MRSRCVLLTGFWIMLLANGPITRFAGAGQSGSKSAAGKTADPAPIEEVQEVSEVESPARSAGGGFLGRLHPALVHFPIAWVFLLQVVEVPALITRREEWRKMGLYLLILACVSFLPAVVTGFFRAASASSDPEFRALMLTHRNLNIAAGAVCLGALALRLGLPNQFERGMRWVYLLLLSVCALLLFVAGHLGGKMVFGQGYLPF